MTKSYRLATRHFTPQILASHIEESFHTLEHGWSNVFGASWQDAYRNLQGLSPEATPRDMKQAIGFTLLIHLPELLCASCLSPSFRLVNLGRTAATFWLCEPCLEDAAGHLQEQQP